MTRDSIKYKFTVLQYEYWYLNFAEYWMVKLNGEARVIANAKDFSHSEIVIDSGTTMLYLTPTIRKYAWNILGQSFNKIDWLLET